MTAFLRIFTLLGLPIFGASALHIWRSGNASNLGRYIQDRIAWTVFALGVCLMLSMALYAMTQESDGDFRTWETIRLHRRVFFCMAAISISPPLVAYLHQATRSQSARSHTKKQRFDELD